MNTNMGGEKDMGVKGGDGGQLGVMFCTAAVLLPFTSISAVILPKNWSCTFPFAMEKTGEG